MCLARLMVTRSTPGAGYARRYIEDCGGGVVNEDILDN